MPSPHDFTRLEETGDEVSDLVNCSETSTGILAGGIDVNNIGSRFKRSNDLNRPGFSGDSRV
jgi:hypothetical protein